MMIIKTFVHSKKEEFDEILLQKGFTQDFLNRFPIKQENKAVISHSTNVNTNGFSITWAVDISLSNR